MKKSIKTFLLIVPLLPIVIISMVLLDTSSKTLSWSLLGVFILSVITFVIYIRQLISIELKRKTKVLWVVFFLYFPNLAEIIFWYKYIKTLDNQNSAQHLDKDG